MLVDKILEDPEFGHLYIRTNARAVRYTFRPANDGTPQCGVLITVPTRYILSDVQSSVEQMRERLRAMLSAHLQARSQQPTAGAAGSDEATGTASRHIDWSFSIESDCLHIYIIKGTREGFSVHNDSAEIRKDERGEDVIVTPARCEILCPPDCDFDAEGRQQWLEKVIVEQVRRHAKAQLIPRMLSYAKRRNITLCEVKVNQSKGHWGSCSRHRKGGGLFSKREEHFNINLSLFTLLLPLSVQRLVLLHELTHTRHMDHSPAFHRDLDVWLGGQEAALEAELKKYTTNVFAFARTTIPPQ